MVWVEVHEKEIYRSKILFTETVTNAIQDILRAIAEDVFPTVGFMDEKDGQVVMYDPDPQVMSGMFPYPPNYEN
jgi:hypothetical protein